jgi:uncharacterized membrane protein
MIDDYPRTSGHVAGPSYYATLAAFPVVCFFGTLVTDLAYWRTEEMLWETFSVWLLTAGLVMAGFAVLAGVVDLVRRRHVRFMGLSWVQIVGHVLAVGFSLVNVFRA